MDIDFLIFLHDRLPEDEIYNICTVNNIDFEEFKKFKEEREYTALPFDDFDTGEFD